MLNAAFNFIRFEKIIFYKLKTKNMKKIILSVSMALMSTVAFSQIETGTKFLGGSASFSSSTSERTIGGTTSDGPEMSSFQIAPSFGYMVTDNIGAGVRIGINNSTTTAAPSDSSESTSSLTTVGLFGRYYAPVAGDKLFFHVDLGFDIGFGTDENEDSSVGGTTTESDVSSFDLGLRPGFDYFIGEKWAIEMNWGSIGYGTRTSETGNFESKSSGLGVDFDFTSIQLGARWYF
jgi:hypothetical protein